LPVPKYLGTGELPEPVACGAPWGPTGGARSGPDLDYRSYRKCTGDFRQPLARDRARARRERAARCARRAAAQVRARVRFTRAATRARFARARWPRLPGGAPYRSYRKVTGTSSRPRHATGKAVPDPSKRYRSSKK
jgi:hypothetical protein